MEAQDVDALFEKHDDEYLKFERIAEGERRHPRPDLCAMLYLHERFGGDGDAVGGSEHDVAWLDWESEEYTEADVIYLSRCGVHWDSDSDCLALFT